ncbi:MAG: hypothetical protein M3P27_06125 [Acidobacteriota bacterium]|nr:hypothetical protein [Acidobacteriota bacterium]
MKNRILGASFVLTLVLTLAVLAFAADNKSAAKSQTINGHLVDVACASENIEKPKADFGAKHSKKCLQMAECEESGYAVLTADNKLIKFDKASNDSAKKFIAATEHDKDWKVAVTGSLNKDNTLKVDKIALQ